MQFAAVYFHFSLAAVRYLSVPIGQNCNGCYYGNHMRSKICVAQKITMELTYFMFLYYDCVFASPHSKLFLFSLTVKTIDSLENE